MRVRAGVEEGEENYSSDGSVTTHSATSRRGPGSCGLAWTCKYFSEALSICRVPRGRGVNRHVGHGRRLACQVSLAGRDRVRNQFCGSIQQVSPGELVPHLHGWGWGCPESWQHHWLVGPCVALPLVNKASMELPN